MKEEPRGLSREEAFRWHMPEDPPKEGCWEWRGRMDLCGYGKVRFGGKTHGAHRASYGVFKGEIPKGMKVLHDPVLCNNPPCVNPNHLRVGTQADNMRDRVLAGTHQRGGEGSHFAKLTEDDVRNIRNSYAAGGINYSELAHKYSVTASTVSDVVRRKTWRHIA